MAVTLTGPAGTWTLPMGTSILGRGADCELRIADPRLSRRHAAFVVAETGIAVQDLGATNGILINGDRVARARDLRHDDVIICGPVALRLLVDPTAPHPAAMRGSSAEFQPHADRSRTATMDPVEHATASAALTGRKLSPAIAAQLAQAHPPPAASPSTCTLQPAPLIAESALVATAQPPGERRRSATALPDQPAPTGSAGALVPRADRPLLGATARRALAAGIDLGLWAAAVAGLGGACLLAGYAIGALRAGVVVAGGAIALPPAAGAPASLAEIIALPGGVAAAADLVGVLQQTRPDAFLAVFLGGVGAALVLALATLFMLIAPTVARGAPLAHRRCGLRLATRGGGPVGWLRATARWTAAALLWPLGAATLLAGVPGLHDLATGTRLVDARAEPPPAPGPA